MSQPQFEWSTADYDAWNDQLLRHCLGARAGRPRVRRILASPEELVRVVSAPAADSELVTMAFVVAVGDQLPRGVSFCGFCHRGSWTPASSETPHFFGMLWFTCLVAAGYPENVGSFADRFKELIGTHDQQRHGKQQTGCLEELWESLAEWSRARDGFAELVLPPRDTRLTVIGRSYYLAFPNRRDRIILSNMLERKGLVGLEPPLSPLLRALAESRDGFSAEFRFALDDFVERSIKGRDDPGDSAFWRAVCSVAIAGSPTADLDDVDEEPVTLIATWDDDETLVLRLAAESDAAIGDAKKEELPFPIADKTHYLTDECGMVDPLVQGALSGVLKLPRRLASVIRQGVLVFSEELADAYALSFGEQVNGANLALVSGERAEAFTQAFGGDLDESRFVGWYEVEGCSVCQLPELPEGLDGVTQLLFTTRAPQPRKVGGVRVSGGYLWSRAFLPVIRCPTAIQVDCRVDHRWLPCLPAAQSGDWKLPPDLHVKPPAKVEVTATFEVKLDEGTLHRSSATSISFVESAIASEYKSAGAGNYWRESCDPEQTSQAGGDAVPLEIATADGSESADLLELDPSLRYLGPGLGQISREPRQGYLWLATGPPKTPRDLVFIGDSDQTPELDAHVSPNKNDRRHWSQAFTSSATRVSARRDGNYVSITDDQRLEQIHKAYKLCASRRRAPGNQYEAKARGKLADVQCVLSDVGGRQSCPTEQAHSNWSHGEVGVSRSVVPSAEAVSPHPSSPVPTNRKRSAPTGGPSVEATELMAALAVRQSGVALREVQNVIAHLVGAHTDFLLMQQIIRAWAEAGLIDMLRRQDRSETIVVARSPRFVMIRRGPAVEARLIGLAPRDLVETIKGLVQGGSVDWIPPTTDYQPHQLQLAGLDPDQMAILSDRIGLRPPQWLRWPTAESPPPYLRLKKDQGGLTHGPPPDAYRFDAKWDWQRMMFRRRPGSVAPGLIDVERRRHANRCAIYVVLLDNEPMLWCHLRSWALLRASELREQPPFTMYDDGSVYSSGGSPMHLPLPLGRLCAVLGNTLPGPILSNAGVVVGYNYAFTPRVLESIQTILPLEWIGKPQREH